MLFISYIYFLSICSILIICIWIILNLLQFFLNRYYGRRLFRFAQIYYYDNVE